MGFPLAVKGRGNSMPFLYILIIVLLATIAGLILFYLWKSAQFCKPTYAKQAVGKMLRGFARLRQYQVFSDVALSCGEESATVEHILVGDFGLLFIASIQGDGSFYGDYKEARWSFDKGKQKIYFKNPVEELERKIELFRKVLAKNKIYNVPLECAVVIVGFSKETKLYINNANKEQPVLLAQTFPGYLRSPHFEVQRTMDQEAVKNLLVNLSK